MKIAVLFIVAICTSSAFAQYQCKDEQGKTSYQDKPCVGNSISVTKPSSSLKPVTPVIKPPSDTKPVWPFISPPQQVKDVVARPAPLQLAPRAVASPSTSSSSRQMPFEQCVVTVNRTALQLGLGGRNAPVVVNSQDLYIRRMCIDDGSVLVTCSRLDASMVSTTSSQPTGCP